MKKIIIAIFLALIFFIPADVFAADLDINCYGTGVACGKSGKDPLFSQALDGYWVPGFSVVRTFKLTNSAFETREAFLKASQTSDTGILEEVIDIDLSPVMGGTPSWSGTLADFYNLSNFSLGNIISGGNVEYKITAKMKPEVNNSYQGLSTKFDLNFSFWLEEASESIASQSVGGVVSGTSDAKPQLCTQTKPGLPTNFTVSVGPEIGQVTLSWLPPSQPYSDFLIAYSDNSVWPPKYGNPNVGNVSSYIVSGLGSGTYWFWVRASNGCSPGDFVGPESTGFVSGIPNPLPVASGFIPGVLGEEEIPAGPIEEVKGESVVACKDCFWWPLLVILTLGLSIYYFLMRRRPFTKWRWIVGFSASAIIYIVFLLINRSCQNNCWWFWILDLLTFMVVALGFKKFLSKD